MVAAAFKDVSFLGCFISLLFVSGDIAKQLLSSLPGAVCTFGEGWGFLGKPPGAIAVHVQEISLLSVLPDLSKLRTFQPGPATRSPAQAPRV